MAAERFLRDHGNKWHARRQAQLMIVAGCANKTGRIKGYFGEIIFEDGSTFSDAAKTL